MKKSFPPLIKNPNLKKKYDPETGVNVVLELQDRGKEYYDRYVVRFNGKDAFWSPNLDETKNVYNSYLKEHFDD